MAQQHVTMTTYVAYMTTDMFSDNIIRKVEANVRNPQASAMSAPGNAYAFFYFDVITVVTEVRNWRVKAKSKRRHFGKTYYIDAELLSAEQVAVIAGDSGIMLDSQGIKAHDAIVRCRTGNFRPFNAEVNELVATS